MVDLLTVCCMCGDVGFPEKLFRCNKCRSRFQHSYCSNYHDEASIAGLCDWCQSEERNLRQGALQSQSKRSVGKSNGGVYYRSAYSGDEIKQASYKEEGSSSERRKNINSSPSPRPSGRRYKLLKDVLC